MELKKQVVSLELAKKLKELGVKQDSLFYWLEYNDEWQVKATHGGLTRKFIDNVRKNARDGRIIPKDCISAFTVAELGETLRLKLGNEHDYNSRPITDENNKGSFKWQARNQEEGLYDKDGNYIFADTEADARAKILIHLLENKLMLS